MLVRRLGLAVPLAFLVAVLMHVALFGADHAPGAEHSEALAAMLGAGLALAALSTVLFAALRKRRGQRWPDTARRMHVTLPELAGGGVVAYALIELGEGRTPLAAGAWLLAALLAASFAVAALASLLAPVLRLSGETLSAYAAAGTLKTSSRFLPTPRRTIRARSAAVVRSYRGRAPPLFS